MLADGSGFAVQAPVLGVVHPWHSCPCRTPVSSYWSVYGLLTAAEKPLDKVGAAASIRLPLRALRACPLPSSRQRTWVSHDVLTNRAFRCRRSWPGCPTTSWPSWCCCSGCSRLPTVRRGAHRAGRGHRRRGRCAQIHIASRLSAVSSSCHARHSFRHFRRGRAARLHRGDPPLAAQVPDGPGPRAGRPAARAGAR